MKIAIMCNGLSSQISDRLELISLLKEKGHDVYVGAVFDGYINPYYKENNIKLLLIDANRNNLNPFVEIKSLLNIRQSIKKEKMDTVIIYGVKNHIAMTMGAWLAGVKKILCVVNGRGNLFNLRGLKGAIVHCMAFPLLRLAYEVSDGICFQNVDDKIEFIKKHIINDSDKVFLTGGSGVNLRKFPQQQLPKENRFLFLARITPSKGLKEYIKAAQIVKKDYPLAQFDIVGPIDSAVENTDLRTFLNYACENQYVNYHGETSDVSSWMGKCRFFIYPSYYPEGVPRSAMQAIATGRPLITCNTAGCKELLKENINGFLVEPGDFRVLAEKMIWMLNNKDAVEQMAQESRRYAEEKFDVDKINNILINKLM